MKAVRARGFSLVELMIAVTLGFLVMLCAIGAFTGVSNTFSAVQGASGVQENARFALEMIARDLRSASPRHCLNYSGMGLANEGGPVDARGGVWAFFDVSDAPLFLGPPLDPSEPWLIDPSAFFRAANCAGGTCSPDPASYLGDAPDLPAVGSQPGERLAASDVLTIRSLRSPGIRVTALADTQNDAFPARVSLGEPALSGGIESGHPAVIADCATTALVKISAAGNELTLSGNLDDDTLPAFETSQARAYDGRELEPITYFLTVSTVDTDQRTGALVRRTRGGDQVLAVGVERLDFLFHLETQDGRTIVLDAEAVDAWNDCRRYENIAGDVAACGWRSVKGVEIHVLATSGTNVRATDEAMVRYAFMADGAPNTASVFEPVADVAAAQALTEGRRLRRHFGTYVAIRGLNR